MQVTSSFTPLADIFPAEAIILGLEHHTKHGVIEDLVHRLVVLGHIAPEAEPTISQMILAREKVGSTALGNGIAFPHCRTSATEKFVGVLGIECPGIAFDSVDGELVSCIFLLLAPLDQREQLFEILGRITAIGRDKSQRFQLRGCQSAQMAFHFLQELDRDLGTREMPHKHRRPHS